MLRRAAHFSTLATPTSPLAAYAFQSAQASFQTAYTHVFSRRADADVAAASSFRERCRSKSYDGQTSGFAPGFVQANLVVLPHAHAFDFLRFCLSNPRACPLLEVTAPGDPRPLTVAPGADLRSDLPRYLIWRDGEVAEERTDVADVWRDDMVGFLLGCSFSWEHLLASAGLTPRHIEQGSNVPMFRTSLRNASAGAFGGHLVVSMRPYLPQQLHAVAEITARYPGAHGAPIHWGDPSALGIAPRALEAGGAGPDWGDAVPMRRGELPVFWACGVTPQEALREARLPLAITHAPGHMFITDLIDEELRVPT